MKKLSFLALSFAAVLWISGFNAAAAQGRGGHGRPSQTGLARAQTVANPEGVQHGIDNAESKQSQTDNQSQPTTGNSKQKKHKKHNKKKS